jgi:hypothetical protein
LRFTQKQGDKVNTSRRQFFIGGAAFASLGAFGGNLTLKDRAVLGFNFTTRDEPVLNLTGKTVTFDEGPTTNVVVKISADAGMRPKSGANVLTSGGNFGAATVSLAEGAPDWVKGISVNEAGNIVLDVKPMGMVIVVQ